jgi:hypothetical protein
VHARNAVCQMLESYHDQTLGCDRYRIVWGRQGEALAELSRWCALEIFEAVGTDPASSGLCGIWIDKDNDAKKYRLVGNVGLVEQGLQRAVRAVLNDLLRDGTSDVGESVVSVVSGCIREERERRVTHLNEAKPRDLLAALVSTALLHAALLIQFLNPKQQKALRELLYRELGNRPRPLRLDVAPQLPDNPTLEQRYAWLHWYLWAMEMHKPERRDALGEVPQYLFVVSGEPPRNRAGELKDPLGPIHAKVWEQLGPEIKKHGTTNINHPHSKPRIARSLGVDRSTLERYLRADIGKEPRPDGKGGVSYTFTGEDVIRAIEEGMRKPGPPPSDR